MAKHLKLKRLQNYFAVMALVVVSINVNAAVSIQNLLVEYSKTPLGLDVKTPRFTWQMAASDAERAISQSAYQLIVTNPEGKVVWDSKKIVNDKSLNIEYSGSPLKPATRYNWRVTVWDQNGKPAVGSSWFETGLMNPDPRLSGWEGATWIGGADEDLVLYSSYLSVFKLDYTIQLDKASGSTRAGFVFGANDSRLMDKNKNIFGIESKQNESYIKFELDITKVNGSENGVAPIECLPRWLPP